MVTFTEFWQLLEKAGDRIGWYSCLRYGPENEKESARIEQHPLQALEAHLEEELELLSIQFSISKQSALVLLALLLTWMSTDGIDHYLVNAERLASVLSLDALDLINFGDEFAELQEKEIIKISDLPLSFVNTLCRIDPIFADYNGLNEMPSRCPLFSWRFELTQDFCEKLKSL